MSFYNGQTSSITVIIQHFKMCRSPHDRGCRPEGILVYHTHIVSNGGEKKAEKIIAQLLSQKTSFVNCQQHKYFVLLFVPFCKKMKKTNQKKNTKQNRKSLLFQACVYSATAILVSKYRTVHAQPCRSTL